MGQENLWMLSVGSILGDIVPNRRNRVYSESCPIHWVCIYTQCAVQRKLMYCGSLLGQAYVKSCGVEKQPPPLHSGHSFPLHPGHYGLSLLTALIRDGHGWCTSSEFVRSLICNPRIQDSKCKYWIYLSSSNTVSWNTPQMFYLCSIDSTYIHHSFLAAV
jgi:hypothetical protein